MAPQPFSHCTFPTSRSVTWTLQKAVPLFSIEFPSLLTNNCSVSFKPQGLVASSRKSFLISLPFLPTGAQCRSPVLPQELVCYKQITMEELVSPLYSETWRAGRDFVFFFFVWILALSGTEQEPCEIVNENRFIEACFWFMAVAVIFQA